MSVKEILVKTKSILQEQGWCQGHYHDHNNSVCLSGAIMEAVYGWVNNGYKDVSAKNAYLVGNVHMLLASLINNAPNIVNWNDMPERNKQEVIDLLDQAIDSCED